MEPQFKLTGNGVAVVAEDLNLLGEAAALADDRVFAELFRMPPMAGSVVSKAIVAATLGELVAPNGATGSVNVYPFRALVGSRTAEATNPTKSARDIRSAVVVGQGSTRAQALSLSANASGNPRWDLVYVRLTPDTTGTSVIRKKKDPTSKVISAVSEAVTAVTSWSLGVVTGTPNAAPTTPALPADTSTDFYIPLAYVRVPTGFTAASTVAIDSIAIVAPAIAVRAGGDAGTRPSTTNGASASLATWGSSGTRNSLFLPTTMVGEESIIVAVNLVTGSESHADGAVVDDSRDWRKRLCRWAAQVTDSTEDFAWATGGLCPSSFDNSTRLNPSGLHVSGLGHTFQTGRRVANLNGANLAVMPDTSYVGLEVDASTGALKVRYANAPNARVLFWITFTSPIDNGRVVT